MLKRASRAAAVAGLCAFFVALTWALSLLGQYICAITIPNQHLRPISIESNRLAVVTVVVTIVVALVLRVFDGPEGGIILAIVGILSSTILFVAAGWLATRTFPGTTISTTPAQILYGAFVAAWGVLMQRIFLKRDDQQG